MGWGGSEGRGGNLGQMHLVGVCVYKWVLDWAEELR
jgi:hypothetical protein